MRPLYIIGCLFLGIAAYTLVRGPQRVPLEHAVSTPPDMESNTGQWFQAAKPYCNVLEVETIHRRSPPPETLEGAGFSAACYALAGRIDRAREIILTVQADSQWKAAGIVFGIGHPIADMGDDRSAGPIMELVVEFWPNHYMALYHAGASNYALERHERAERYLREFLRHYKQDDGWTRSAHAMLDKIGG